MSGVIALEVALLESAYRSMSGDARKIMLEMAAMYAARYPAPGLHLTLVDCASTPSNLRGVAPKLRAI